MPKLNLGSGYDIRENWINLDYKYKDGIDVVWDLNNNPLPFESNYFDEIECNHVFEHLFKWEDTLLECYRILKPNGKITIRVPYKLYGLRSAYHVRYFGKYTFDTFCTLKQQGFQGLDDKKFIMEFKRVNKTIPFVYHINKYFKIDLTNHHNKIKRYGLISDELIVILRKPFNEYYGNFLTKSQLEGEYNS